MYLPFKNDLALIPDLGHRLRQWRWFRATFRKCTKTITAYHGSRYEIDETALAKVFLDWTQLLDRQKAYARVDRADFITFAAGLALREFIRHRPARALLPLTATAAAAVSKPLEIVRFWPEGFLYTNYCVCAIVALLEQEFSRTPQLDEYAYDLRFWWSYRENASEIPALAIPFLDRMLGVEPNWIAPELPEGRLANSARSCGNAPAPPQG